MRSGMGLAFDLFGGHDIPRALLLRGWGTVLRGVPGGVSGAAAPVPQGLREPHGLSLT